jgi:precorrin-6Y C5,15-methyltransferase (decarboxylating)
MNHFILIGISDHPQPEFSREVKEIVRTHRIFSGGKRHYSIVREMLPKQHEWLNITIPISEVLEQYKSQSETIVVFASGDPLFYGFANTLQREFPEAKLQVHSYFNSLQLLAQKCSLPYAHMTNTSVTGRPWDELDKALIEGKEMIGVLTDKKKTPAQIAQRLLEYGYYNYQLTIGEALGGSEEKIETMNLENAAKRDFNTLNCVILSRITVKQKHFGIAETEFHHLEGRPKMITKMPIRLFSLALLDLTNRKVFWDVGFCTGSVSIEARLQFPHLTICSFEIREESDALFDQNTRKFGAPGIQKYIGDFFNQNLDLLPRPDAVFIGGHGGRIKEMITLVAQYLSSEGVIVINAVAQKSQTEFLEICKELKLNILSKNTMVLDDHNPITLIAATKRG